MITEGQMNLFGTAGSTVPKDEKKKEPKANYQIGKLYLVDISSIVVNAAQSRKHFADEKILALAESIRKHGILQPVICMEAEDGVLRLCAGERRLRAAIAAGLGKVPVWMVRGDQVEVSLVENMLREDLTAVEEAEAVLSLKRGKSYRLEDLAIILSKAVSTISEMVAVASLPLEIRDDCRCNSDVPRDILVQISRLPTDEDKISQYKEFKEGRVKRYQLKSAGRSANAKTLHVHTIVTSFAKRISRFKVEKMDQEEKDSFCSELEKLQNKINETLKKLRG